MSDKNHTGLVSVSFWIDQALLEQLDCCIKARGYVSRVEWFREQVRNEIQKNPPQK